MWIMSPKVKAGAVEVGSSTCSSSRFGWDDIDSIDRRAGRGKGERGNGRIARQGPSFILSGYLRILNSSSRTQINQASH